jgi:hypothetical protein
VFAIAGGVRPGWVKGAGSGIAAGPDGGARFIAGPEGGASGTAFGGTGGGRSENIWAEAVSGTRPVSSAATVSAGKSLLARPLRPIP